MSKIVDLGTPRRNYDKSDTARSTALYRQLAGVFETANNLPSADVSFLVSLRKSREYRSIRRRLAGSDPIDTWQEEKLHYFVFELKDEEGMAAASSEPPVALFTMRHEQTRPVAAVIIAGHPDGGRQAKIKSLRWPGRVYMVLLRAK